jgi:hypothetical protein
MNQTSEIPQQPHRPHNPYAFARPAFKAAPQDYGSMGFYNHEQDGMTLRDFFAANALHALIAANHWDTTDIQLVRNIPDIRNKTANLAYQYADAMLHTRTLQPLNSH